MTVRPVHVLLLLAAGLALAHQPPTQAKDPRQLPRGLKVAVVDFGALFRGYGRKAELEERLNKRRKAFRQELEREKQALVAQRRELKLGSLKKGSQEEQEAREKLKVAKFQWELKGKRLQKALREQVERDTLALLQELRRGVRSWAKAQGYELVLKVDDSGQGPVAKGDLTQFFQEQIFRAQISDVLYHEPSKLDVTEAVLKYLNRSR